MVITNKWIADFSTPRGAWTKQQLAAIGVAWPPYRGWRRDAIGRVITAEQQAIFEAGHLPRVPPAPVFAGE